MAHRAPRPSDTGAGAGRQPREGGVTMLMARASKTEGRRGSQRRLDEGGRYLGIPQNGGLAAPRSEEHTSELQSRLHLVCRLLLEKKKKTKKYNIEHKQKNY